MRRLFKKKKFWNKKVSKMTVGDTIAMSGILTFLAILPFVGPIIKEIKDI